MTEKIEPHVDLATGKMVLGSGLTPQTGPQIPEGLIPADLDLVGMDGNAFAIIGAVKKALREPGNSDATIREWQAVATAGDYDWLLVAAMEATA